MLTIHLEFVKQYNKTENCCHDRQGDILLSSALSPVNYGNIQICYETPDIH